MDFEPIYYEKDITVINKKGDIAIVTLWSLPSKIIDQLKSFDIDLSRISAVGTLYGNGLSALLRNLIYNPQIEYLIIGGRDRSQSKSDLFNYFMEGTEEINFFGSKMIQIKGTQAKIDLSREDFHRDIDLFDADDFKDKDLLNRIMNAIPSQRTFDYQRIKLPEKKIDIKRMPADIHVHHIDKDNPLDCWKEIIYRCYSFGKESLQDRYEISNLKTVIRNPNDEEDLKLKKYGYSISSLRSYSYQLLNKFLPSDTSYTYGNRITKHFEINTLEKCIKSIKEDANSRGAYMTIWDNNIDIGSKEKPCLVSLFFRKEEENLNLTATFRSHNIMDAWIPNCYGMIYILNMVSKICNIKKGILTIISHSASISIDKLEEAILITKKRKNEIELDRLGNFKIDIKYGKIIIYHIYQGIIVKEYSSVKASALQHQIYKDRVVSNVGHAMYIGRQLERAEFAIKNNIDFIQE